METSFTWGYSPEFEAWLRDKYPGAFKGGRYSEQDMQAAFSFGRSLLPEATARAGELSDHAWYHLFCYLQNHEGDIAHGINDFGDLHRVFREVVDREAESYVSTPQRLSEED